MIYAGIYLIIGLISVACMIYEAGLKVEEIGICLMAVLVWPVFTYFFLESWSKDRFPDGIIIKSKEERLKESIIKYEEKLFLSEGKDDK